MEFVTNVITMILMVSFKGMFIKSDLMSKLAIIKLYELRFKERRS